MKRCLEHSKERDEGKVQRTPEVDDRLTEERRVADEKCVFISELQRDVNNSDDLIVYKGYRSPFHAVDGLERYYVYTPIPFRVCGEGDFTEEECKDITAIDVVSIDWDAIELPGYIPAIASHAGAIEKLAAKTVTKRFMFTKLRDNYNILSKGNCGTSFTVVTVIEFFLSKVSTASTLAQTEYIRVPGKVAGVDITSTTALLELQRDASETCDTLSVDLDTKKRRKVTFEEVHYANVEELARSTVTADGHPKSLVTSMFSFAVQPSKVASSKYTLERVVLDDERLYGWKVVPLPDGWILTWSSDSADKPLIPVVCTRCREGVCTTITTWMPTPASELYTFKKDDGRGVIVFQRRDSLRWCMLDPLCGATSALEVREAVKFIPNHISRSFWSKLITSHESPYILVYDSGCNSGTINVFKGLAKGPIKQIKTMPFKSISRPHGSTCVIGGREYLGIIKLDV